MYSSENTNNWYVYRHIRLDKLVPFYIGIGCREKYKRAYEKTRNNIWKRITQKTEFSVQILLKNLSKEEAVKKEKEFIALYKRLNDGGTLCNLTLGGEGISGLKRSNETKIKISSKNKGRKLTQEQKDKIRQTLLSKIDDEYRKKSSQGRKGKKISDEHKAIISLSNKGKIKSEDTKKKMSEWQKGRKFSEEHKLKLSLAKLGRKISDETKLKMSISQKRRYA